ncbi:hypothetical protein V6N13_005984 [Hibiscus sabdariffa]
MRGVAVFVNFVSKRIHPSTPKDAFETYGKVIDVFIAINNIKRRDMRSTFAFVSFSNLKEAMNAINGANNRKIDGFDIKVILDTNVSDRQSFDAWLEADVWKFVWPNLAPPRVEAFVWRAVHGKVEVSKRGCSNLNSLACPLCNEVDETVSHLFCHGKFSCYLLDDGSESVYISPCLTDLFLWFSLVDMVGKK